MANRTLHNSPHQLYSAEYVLVLTFFPLSSNNLEISS